MNTPISPKVLVGTLLAAVTPVLLAMVTAFVGYVVDNPHVLQKMPWYVTVPVLAGCTAIAVLVGGYKKRDPLRPDSARREPLPAQEGEGAAPPSVDDELGAGAATVPDQDVANDVDNPDVAGS